MDAAQELSLISVLVMIAASVLVLAVFRRLDVPPLLGYVVVGVTGREIMFQPLLNDRITPWLAVTVMLASAPNA